MELFDKQYIYFEWDDKLNNAEVIVADELTTLKRTHRKWRDILLM